MKKHFPLLKWLACFGSATLILFLFWLMNNAETAESDPLLCYSLRGAIVFFSMIGWFTSRTLIVGRGTRPGFVGDRIHELTAPLHDYLGNSPRIANLVLIVSSAFIDILGIFLITTGVFGPTMRPFGALIILFFLRKTCQVCCALPVPAGMIWRHPGFPSLFVSYHVSNDLFFSGPTAIAVLGAIEAVQLFPWWLGAAVTVIAVGEAVVVLILRAHYTLDVFAAVLAAFCAADLANWLAELFFGAV